MPCRTWLAGKPIKEVCSGRGELDFFFADEESNGRINDTHSSRCLARSRMDMLAPVEQARVTHAVGHCAAEDC